MEGKKNSGGGALSYKGEKKKKDLRKIKRFSCQQFGHYATKCPEQKKGSKKDLVATPAKIVLFSSHFEEFSLNGCMERTVATNV